MKNKYINSITLLVAFIFCGCSERQKRREALNQVENMRIVEFDGCEYLVSYRRLSHKGNCKYCTNSKR